MSEENTNMFSGPVAPKDPDKQRRKIYLMADGVIEAMRRPNGEFSEIMFLEGRVPSKIAIICPKIDPALAQRLPYIAEFRKIVHSIGVTVTADEEQYRTEPVEFSVQAYGKTDKYVSGTTIHMNGMCNGAEMKFDMADWKENPDDDYLGTIYYRFQKPGITAKASICFYLNDGFDDVPEPELDPPVEFGTDRYKEMLSGAVMSRGNDYRLKKVFEKAAAGEEITLAFIGGSITQGAGAKPQWKNCYAYRTFEAMKEMLHTDKIRYVKAGVGGTSSELGMVRYYTDVKKEGTVDPDIVVIEFAVNDEGDETKGVSFESLARKILKEDQKPAVVLLFSVFMDDYNLQDRLAPIGYHYDLPMVSVKNAVVPQFNDESRRVITKRQYFYDIYHPSNEGHIVMKDCLMELFRSVYSGPAQSSEDIVLPEKPEKGYQFTDIFCIDRKNMPERFSLEPGDFTEQDANTQAVEMDDVEMAVARFTNNWYHTPEAGNAPLVLKGTMKACVLTFKDEGDPTFGKADVYADGKFVRTINPLEVGWNHLNTAIVIDEPEAAFHTVEVRMQPGEENKKFTVLGFGIVE